jgi:2-iminoacetate synthase ThiH
MMYGSVETMEQRVAHILWIRAVQDEALALADGGMVGWWDGGMVGTTSRSHPLTMTPTHHDTHSPLTTHHSPGRFTAFISWSFQPDKTALAARREVRKASGFDYLRTVAVARLLLDNIENFQASYVTQGPKIAQIALHYGLNDFGSTMMEENVVSAANTNFLMPIAEIERLIREAGFEPRRRNTKYDFVMRDT